MAKTNAALSAPQPKRQPVSSGVTELVLAANEPQQLAMVLPMIAHLSHKETDRWITWIAPQGIDRSLLEAFGVDTQRLRLIHSPSNKDYCWVIWEALRTGTSHTVIANIEALPEKAINQLNEAAHVGHCDGLLLRFR